MSKESILFLGGAGFIGSAIIKNLVSQNRYEIHVLEPISASKKRILGLDVKIHDGHLSDLRKLDDILLSYNVKIVVHLVSSLTPGSQYVDFVEEFQSVVFPSIQLMHICAARGVKLIYFSSGGTVYGERSSSKPFSEKDPLSPISHYGWLKQMMENSILFVHRTMNLKYLIVRPSNPYGPGQNLYGKQGIIAVAIGKILDNSIFEVWGDGSAVRDYIYIDDLANIICKLIDNNIDNLTLNIGSGVGASVNEILDILKKIVGKKIQIDYKNARNTDVSNVILNTEKLKSLISYDLISLEDGISKFYKYAQNKRG